MKNKSLRTLTTNYIIPMVRLLHESGCSSFYNYLPMETSDKDGLSWVYYYQKLEVMRDFLKRFRFESETDRSNMQMLLEDVRRMIVSCEGATSLPDYWFYADPELQKCAFDLNSDDQTVAGRLLHAFINLVLFLIPDSGEIIQTEIQLLPELKDRRLTTEEKEELKTSLSAIRANKKIRAKEVKIRKQLLEAFLGSSVQCPMSASAQLWGKLVEKSTGYTVYHAIERKDRIIFLCMTDEMLYWENQRPSASRFGVYAFGYEMYHDSALKGGYGQVRLDSH